MLAVPGDSFGASILEGGELCVATMWDEPVSITPEGEETIFGDRIMWIAQAPAITLPANALGLVSVYGFGFPDIEISGISALISDSPSPPTLHITGSGSIITISWPASIVNGVLEHSPDLGAFGGGWSALDAVQTLVGDEWAVSVPAGRRGYFRLVY